MRSSPMNPQDLTPRSWVNPWCTEGLSSPSAASLGLANLHVTASAWLPACFRAASGQSIGSLQSATFISIILWAPEKTLPYRDRVRAKLPPDSCNSSRPNGKSDLFQVNITPSMPRQVSPECDDFLPSAWWGIYSSKCPMPGADT